MSAGSLTTIASNKSIAIGAAVVIALGYAGLVQEAHERLGPAGADLSGWLKILLDNVVRSFKFFSVEVTPAPEKTNWFLILARVGGAIVATMALLKLIATAFGKHFAALRARFSRDHAVLLGLGARNSLFAADLARAGSQGVVALDLTAPAQKAIGAGRRGIGLDADLDVPARALASNPKDARTVVIGAGSNERNLALAAAIVEAHGRGKRQVVVTVDDPGLAERCEFEPAVTRPATGDEVFIFNAARVTARMLFERRPIVDLALARSQRRVRLVVLGSSDVAIECLLQFLRISPCVELDRPLAQLVGQAPGSADARLLARAPSLLGALSQGPEPPPTPGRGLEPLPLSWALALETFADAGGSAAPTLATLDALDEASGGDPVTAVVVASGDSVQNVLTSLALIDRARDRPGWDAPVFVHTSVRSSLDKLLSPYRSEWPPRAGTIVVEPFGQLADVCRIDAVVGEREAAARRLHEAYRAHHAAGGAGVPGPDWERLEETFRRANRRAIDHLPTKRLSAARLAARDGPAKGDAVLDALASMEHDSWRIDRELEGWSHAAAKDPQRRKHPDLTPFDALAPASKEAVRSLVRALAAADPEIGRAIGV